MAYVREHGNQLAIVHGERDRETGKVRQRVLFKICSKPEARAVVAERDQERGYLEGLLESRYRQIDFDWSKIRAGIEERMDDLPDIYPYRQAEMLERFREDLCSFTRQLGHADPQVTYSAAELIREHRAELEYLRGLIDSRLQTCEQEENQWNGDNEFFWRARTRSENVPPAVIEMMSDLYFDRELDRVEKLARLFIDCFQDYVDGHNYLGLVARDRGELEEAIEHFERAIEEGRARLPKGLAREHYWVDMETRPYMRGLENLAETLTLAGRYEAASEVCDRLENECGDDAGAARLRAYMHLVAGRPGEAREVATQLVGNWPQYSYIAAFASHELGEEESAVAWFIHGLLTRHRAGLILLGLPTEEPQTFEAVQDHNIGVHMCTMLAPYLEEMSFETYDFFEAVLGAGATFDLLVERGEVEEGWRDDRELSERRTELMSTDFAFHAAPDVLQEIA